MQGLRMTSQTFTNCKGLQKDSFKQWALIGLVHAHATSKAKTIKLLLYSCHAILTLLMRMQGFQIHGILQYNKADTDVSD